MRAPEQVLRAFSSVFVCGAGVSWGSRSITVGTVVLPMVSGTQRVRWTRAAGRTSGSDVVSSARAASQAVAAVRAAGSRSAVGGRRVIGQREQERQTRRRARVHVTLVMGRTVETAERPLPGLGVR